MLDARGRPPEASSTTTRGRFLDVGPTLDAVLAEHAPALIDELVAADRESLRRTGHGDAWAQAYNHPILPLCTPRDVRTQVLGRARSRSASGACPKACGFPRWPST